MTVRGAHIALGLKGIQDTLYHT